MKVLILGGSGMLGHQLYRHLRERYTVHATFRTPPPRGAPFEPQAIIAPVDVRRFQSVLDALDTFEPSAVVNAVGAVKQRPEGQESIAAIEINALFPHRLAMTCAQRGIRLLHFSTDCVYSGRRGNYSENDEPDPQDLYGRSKLLGEPRAPGCIVLRASIIGPELGRRHGLLEWFLAQRGPVPGYRRARFSGLTTFEMARVVERFLEDDWGPGGVYHVSADAISKFELLRMLRERMPGGDPYPDDSVVIDRSLDSTRFRRRFGYTPPSWPAMLDELATRLSERGA